MVMSEAYNFYFCFRSQETLSMVEDFEIDIPQVCEYLGEVFGKYLLYNWYFLPLLP